MTPQPPRRFRVWDFFPTWSVLPDHPSLVTSHGAWMPLHSTGQPSSGNRRSITTTIGMA